MKLRDDLERRGVTLTPKLRYQITDGALDAETLALLKANRDELLRHLAAPDSVPRLPWQLEALLRAANSDVLPTGMCRLERGAVVYDLRTYTLACAASYLLGDREAALERLWRVHGTWRQVN